MNRATDFRVLKVENISGERKVATNDTVVIFIVIPSEARDLLFRSTPEKAGSSGKPALGMTPSEFSYKQESRVAVENFTTRLKPEGPANP